MVQSTHWKQIKYVSVGPDTSEQAVQTQIRLLIKRSDQSILFSISHAYFVCVIALTEKSF